MSRHYLRIWINLLEMLFRMNEKLVFLFPRAICFGGLSIAAYRSRSSSFRALKDSFSRFLIELS